MDLRPRHCLALCLALAGCHADLPGPADQPSGVALLTLPTGSQAPTALDDAFTVAENDDYSGDVLANDVDPDGGSLEVTAVQGLASNVGIFVHLVTDALVTIESDGSLLYESLDRFEALADGQTTTESFTYEVTDDEGDTATATVTMTIVGVNDAPTILPDDAGVPVGGSRAIDVLWNDADVDDGIDPGSVTVTTAPSWGTTSVDPVSGVITYTHTTSSELADSLVYEACDLFGDCGTATVTLAMYPLDTPPVAVDDWEYVEEGAAVAIEVAANDDDPLDDMDLSSVTVTSAPIHGTATADPSTGLVTYQHDGTEPSTDRFDYRICNGQGLCDEANVTLSVLQTNDAPVAIDDAARVRPGRTVLIPVLENDIDPEDDLDAWTMEVTVAPAHGATELDIAGMDIFYTHDGGDAVEDAFRYRICDHDGACDEADVTVEIGDYDDTGDTLWVDPGTVDSFPEPSDDRSATGCGCNASGGHAGWLGLAVGLLATTRRRRR